MATHTSLPDPLLKNMSLIEGTPVLDRSMSWSAVIAGAAGAAALSLILLMLGVGLGLSSISPWTQAGLSAGALGLSTIAWLTITQLLASGAGGYLAGRLRPRSFTPHLDETYFRDTAHGFLAWSVATLATAALLGSTLSAVVGSGMHAGASVAGSAVQTVATQGMQSVAKGGELLPYFTDQLFRDGAATATSGGSDNTPQAERSMAEALRILGQAFSAGSLSAEDSRRLGQLVARQTGLSQEDAERRVSTIYERAQARARESEESLRNVADQARQLSARTTLWMFISLLVGALVASLMATYGGRHQRA